MYLNVMSIQITKPNNKYWFLPATGISGKQKTNKTKKTFHNTDNSALGMLTTYNVMDQTGKLLLFSRSKIIYNVE